MKQVQFQMWPPDGTIHQGKSTFHCNNLATQKKNHMLWQMCTAVITAHQVLPACILPGVEVRIRSNRERWCQTRGPCVQPKPADSFSAVK